METKAHRGIPRHPAFLNKPKPRDTRTPAPRVTTHPLYKESESRKGLVHVASEVKMRDAGDEDEDEEFFWPENAGGYYDE